MRFGRIHILYLMYQKVGSGAFANKGVDTDSCAYRGLSLSFLSLSPSDLFSFDLTPNTKGEHFDWAFVPHLLLLAAADDVNDDDDDDGAGDGYNT